MAFSFRIGTNWCHDFPKLARESGFFFNMHRSRVRVDWNRISNIDIERVIRERDFATVDENVNNVVDYCLESEYDVKILDPNFVKLFRLAQLAVEYLLYCKQYLDHSVVILKDELRLKIEENVKSKKEISTLEEVIKHLKDRSKEKGKFIETKIGDCNGEIYKCPHCPKTFVSAMFVSAHVARRHPYITDLRLSSPLHDQYRAETEKLHDEIKALKERLNQTERVIRNETERSSEKTKENYERRHLENDTNDSKNTKEKSTEQQERKGYQEEISSLKNMLFDEIRNLRQREKSMYEYASETNVQTLISQQEKEFQKLRNQLLERLTPDIESVQAKLHAQEDFWRSKIEHLEYQHQKDVEKLTDELRETQKTADRIKAEYESKVSELERQTLNQTNILLEQGKQLHTLTRERNNPQNDRFKSPEKVLSEKTNRSAQSNNTSYKEPSEVIVQDIDSVSSVESAKLISSLPTSKLVRRTQTVKVESKRVVESKDKEDTRRKNTRSSKKPDRIEDLKKVKRDFNDESTDLSDSQDLPQEKHTRVQEIKKSMVKSVEEAKPRIVEEVTSESKSESVTSESQTDSESESVSTITNTPVHEYKNTAKAVAKSKRGTQYVDLKQLRLDLQEAFDKKLRDLGIDPEWQGLPRATFKQKMDILKHHQSITAKKLPKYHQIKLKVLEELLKKLPKTNKESENLKAPKKSLGKLVTNVKSKALKAFGNQRIPEGNVSDVTKEPQMFSRHRSKPGSQDSLESISTQSTRNSDNRNNTSRIKLSPSLIGSQESTRRPKSLYDSPSRNSYDSSRIKPFFDAPPRKLTSTPINRESSVSFGNDGPNLSSVKQESIHDFLASPRNNKSVLKSSTGSTGSLVKKKVIFDLTNDRDEGSLSEYDVEKDELNESDWNASSLSDGGEDTSEKEKPKNTGNIILKTSQSEKIAEISKKIEAQLSVARQQPVGSVETMFSSMFVQGRDNPSTDITNVASFLKSSPRTVNSKASADSFPQPAPRNLRDKVSEVAQPTLDDSDLDTDIEEILKVE